MSTRRRTGEVFAIGFPGPEAGSASVAGFKAFNLRRMAAAGLPVPQAFVLGTGWCALHAREPQACAAALGPSLAEWSRRLEEATGLVFGGERRPLLVSVRSGAPVSMPGMMDTLLNVGLCERSLRGLLRATGNPRLAWDSWRRFVQQYAEVVHGVDPAPFEALVAEEVARAGVEGSRELDYRSLAALAAANLELFAELCGGPFPQDPAVQLQAAVGAVLESWQSARAREYRRLHGIDESMGTAVTVQRMVFGNAGGTSGSGVGFTRDPSTGENRLYLDFLFDAQGEDVVSGRHAVTDTSRLARVLPEVAARLESLRGTLEGVFGDVQEFEFTVQDGRLFLLQTRTAKRTPWAALRIAVEQVREGQLGPAAALARLEGIALEGIRRDRIVDGGAEVLAEAVPAGMGMTTGPIALDAAAAGRFAAAGQAPVLVRAETSTEDIAAFALAAGVLTATGGRTSHAAVIARQMAKVCLVGCRALAIDAGARCITLGGRRLREGELLCLDADRGLVLAGRPETVSERPEELLAEVAAWRRVVT